MSEYRFVVTEDGRRRPGRVETLEPSQDEDEDHEFCACGRTDWPQHVCDEMCRD